jgi:hypothetical protein
VGRPSRADNAGAARAALSKNSGRLARADVGTARTDASYTLALGASAKANHTGTASAGGVFETRYPGELSSAKASDSVGVPKAPAADHAGAPRAAGSKDSRGLVRKTWDLASKADAYNTAAAGTRANHATSQAKHATPNDIGPDARHAVDECAVARPGLAENAASSRATQPKDADCSRSVRALRAGSDAPNARALTASTEADHAGSVVAAPEARYTREVPAAKSLHPIANGPLAGASDPYLITLGHPRRCRCWCCA